MADRIGMVVEFFGSSCKEKDDLVDYFKVLSEEKGWEILVDDGKSSVRRTLQLLKEQNR